MARSPSMATVPVSPARRPTDEARTAPRHLRSVGTPRREHPPHLRAVPTPTPVPLPELLRHRDPALLRRAYPWLRWVVDKYFRCEVEGVEHLPDSASMMVGTHNGAMTTPDLYALFLTYWRRFGFEAPFYGLGHRAVFEIPFVRDFCLRAGAIPAHPENAKAVLDADFPLLVYPGGDVDALKPFSQRHRITFAGRKGFIRTALRHQVPIVPVISVGAHETLYVLNDGAKLAKLLRINRWLRVKSVPLTLSFPFGLTIASVPTIPLPSKLRLQVLPPIELGERADAADNPERVQRCYDHVVATMQQALDELAARRRFPILG
jgi:1-acyl-sn-glycerol-3-phosphate acyltransferase